MVKSKKIKTSTKLKLCVITATLLSCLNITTQAATIANSPKNIIGFFQSYDNANPQVWYFNTGETISTSGYTVLIDAFWVNYPFCWGDGSGTPGKGSPIPECKGIKNQPGPGLSNSLASNFWKDYKGGAAPSIPGQEYNDYWTSLHTSGPQTISNLRQKINANGEKIKLLASIGGWNMGGSSAGQPSKDLPSIPAWAALLQSPEQFANALSQIMNLKVSGVQLYDGIDIDIETLYGEGCAITNQCTKEDEQKATNDMVQAILLFKKNNPTALLSISPRAADLVCEQNYCNWNEADGVGFVGNILQKLAKSNVYFDDINAQFYNDDPQRNIPNKIENGELSYGSQVVGMLKKIHDIGIIGPNTSFNVGVLAQTNGGEVESSESQGNPGVPKTLIKKLWEQLQTDPAIINTGIKIDGLMDWAANLALKGSGVGGNVRTVQSLDTDPHVVPYNWASDLTN